MRRKRADGPRRGAIGWLAIAALLLLSAFTVWKIVQTSTADALIRRKPIAVAVVAPRDPRLPLTMAMLEFRASGGAVRPATQRAALDALDRAPLADEPLFLAGIDALIHRDEAKALRLLLEARKRNPRSRYVRLILLDRYLRAGRINEATGEMTALGKLIPGANDVLIPELGRLAQSPATGRALEAALRRNPDQRDALLEYLASASADPNLILRLARNVPARSGPAGKPAWQGKLVDNLVARGAEKARHKL